MQSPQFDAIEFKKFELPYNRLESELSDEPRIVSGKNSYITAGGKLTKRPGTTDITGGITALNRRIDRLEFLETIGASPIVFLLASAFNYGTNLWEMWYLRLTAGSPAWTQIPNLRAVHQSTLPHEMVVVRGMAYIFAFPASGNSEKIAAVIFDPTTDPATPRTMPWGISAPTQAAKVGSNVSVTLTSDIDAATATIPLSTLSGLPSVPFPASIGSEQLNVTAKSSATITLGVAELQVFAWDPVTSSNANVAQTYGTASQSTTSLTATWATANKGRDGNTDGQLGNGHVALTQPEANPWWQVDLGGNYSTTGQCVLFNRTDSGAPDMTDYWIFASPNAFLAGDTPATLSVRANTIAYHNTGYPSPSKSLFFSEFVHGATTWTSAFQARYVRVQLTGGIYVTVTRGYNNSVAALHYKGDTLGSQTWASTTYPVTVRYGWRYKYAYKTQSGHIGPASADDSTPGTANSNTYAFTGKIPQISFKDSASGSGITDIVFYRTLDGGGSWLKLGSVAATGTGGTLTYTDNGGSSGDPVSDLKLDTSDVAASITQNNTPPRVIAPKVAEVDTPMPSTPFAYYQGRIWYGVGNILLFSGNEEVTTGVPEESFFTGTTGNFMRFQHPVTRVISTSTGLYVFTTQSVHKITGNNRESFNANLLYDNIGAPFEHPRASCQFADNVAFLTHDFRVGIVSNNDEFRTISDPLFDDIVTAINAGCEIEVNYWADLDKEWIVVTAVKKTDMTACKAWVYDIKKTQALKEDFWNTPWPISSTCVLSSRVREDQSERRLVFAMFDTTTHNTVLAAIDPTGVTATDFLPGAGATGFGFDAITSLFKNPTGNHLNSLRAPAHTSVIEKVQLERSVFAGDTDPQFAIYTDDLWTTPIEPVGPADDPNRREVSIGYKTMLWTFNEVCQRVAVGIHKLKSPERFELQTMALLFTPDSGE